MTSATVCIVPCTSYTYYNIMYHNNYDVSERRAHTHTAYTDIHIHTTRPHYEFSIVFLYYNMSCCHEICLCVRMQTSVCVCEYIYVCVDKHKPWMFQLSCGPCTKQNGQVCAFSLLVRTRIACVSLEELDVYI